MIWVCETQEGLRVRYLLTGGAGFIGCNATARLKRRGDDVVVVDNLSRPGSVANAKWLAVEHGVQVTQIDLRQADAIAACVAKARPDVVLHCAAQVAVTTSVTDPRRDFEDNALGTFNLLEAVRLGAPEAVLLYTSTNKVYGGMEDVGIELHDGRYRYVDLPNGCDEQRPLDFHSPYGCSKGAADQYVRDYARIYGLTTVCFASHASTDTASSASRIRGGSPGSLSAGARQAGHHLRRRPTGAGRALHRRPGRCFPCRRRAHLDRSGRIYNIGGGPSNQMSLLDLVAHLERLSGRQLQVEFAGWRPGDQRIFVCDSARQAVSSIGPRGLVRGRRRASLRLD